MHVVEPVHCPDQIAGSKPRSSLDTQAQQFLADVVGDKAGRVERSIARAAGANVDVGEIADTQPLVERADAVVRDRAGYDAIANCVNARPLLDADVDADVESFLLVAAHLTKAARNLVWISQWRKRPQERSQAEGVHIEPRTNGRRRGRLQAGLRRGGDLTDQRIACVGDDQLPRPSQRYP